MVYIINMQCCTHAFCYYSYIKISEVVTRLLPQQCLNNHCYLSWEEFLDSIQLITLFCIASTILLSTDVKLNKVGHLY